MVIETMVGAALGYLVKSIKESKGAEKAADEMSTAVWEWIRPIFLTDDKEDEALTDLKNEPDDADNQKMVEAMMKKYLKKNPEKAAALEAALKAEEAQTGFSPGSVNIINQGKVGKQVNNSTIQGDLNM